MCKLKKMSNTKKEVAAEGGEGQADPEDAADAPGVPDHDGTPSKLFPGAKGDRSAKRKGERRHRRGISAQSRVVTACARLLGHLRGIKSNVEKPVAWHEDHSRSFPADSQPADRVHTVVLPAFTALLIYIERYPLASM